MRFFVFAVTAVSLLAIPVFAAANTGIGKGVMSAGPQAPSASHIQIGAVIAIDLTNSRFTYHTENGDVTVQAGKATNFRQGHNVVGISDIKAGQSVEVLSHMVNNRLFADLVVIQ